MIFWTDRFSQLVELSHFSAASRRSTKGEEMSGEHASRASRANASADAADALDQSMDSLTLFDGDDADMSYREMV